MATPFETTILKLKELGFFQFLLPFFIAAAIIYGLLRKTQLFGPPEKNIAINAVVAMGISFFILAWPIMSGVNIETQLSAFFMQGLSTLLVIMVILLVAGMVLPPDLPKALGEKIKGGPLIGGIVVVGIIIGIILLVSSGLSKVFLPQGVGIDFPSETLTTIGIIVLLLGIVVVIVFMAR